MSVNHLFRMHECSITRILLRCCLLILYLFAAGCAPKSLAPEVSSGNARFFVRLPAATSVAIAGSFNRWDPGRDRLAGPDREGIWTIVLPLQPGRYEYRFVVNNRDWVLDPSAPAVDDELGSRNSLIVVEP